MYAMSGEYSSSESSCSTGRSSTNTSNSTPRSVNTNNTPRTNSTLNSAYSTPRESGSGINSTNKRSNKYDESLIPKFYSQLLELRNGSVLYNTLSSRDKVIPPVRKVCRRLGVKKLSEISSDEILYNTLVEVMRENNNVSTNASTASSNLPLISKLRISDINLIEILRVTVERLMKSEKFKNSSNDMADNYIYYDSVNDKLTSTPVDATVASTKLPSIAYVIAINLFWETTSTLFKSICSHSCSYNDCLDLFFELIVIILSVGKLDPISMYSFLGPLDLITQRAMYELSDKVVGNSIYSSQLFPYETSCKDYYCQFVAMINSISKPLQEYISSFITNDIAQYSIKKSQVLSRQLFELLCWCSSYRQTLPPVANFSKSININDLLIKFLSDDYDITVDNTISTTWLGIGEHMKVTLSSLLSISIKDRVSASLLDCTGLTSIGIFGMILHSHMHSELFKQSNPNIIEFCISLNETDMKYLAQNDSSNRRDQGSASRLFKSLIKDTRSTCESLMASLMSHMSNINKNAMKISESKSREDLKNFAKRNADMSLLCHATEKFKTDEAAILNSTTDNLKNGNSVDVEEAISLITKISNDLISFGYSSQCYIPPSSVNSDKTMKLKFPLVVQLQDLEGLGAYGITSKQPLGCTITYVDVSYDMVCAALRQVTNGTSKACMTMKLFIALVLLFAKQHKLIELTDGFLNVSAFLHLIVYFLLRNNLIQIDNSMSSKIAYKLSSASESEGDSIESCDPITLLHKFCYYYSFEFNIFDDVVSITTGNHMHKSLKSQYRSCVLWRLYIEDISNNVVDMGSMLTRSGQIQLFKAFRRGTFATQYILQSIKSQNTDARDLIPHLFDNRMLDLAMVGGYKGANVLNVPTLNQLIYRRPEDYTNTSHKQVSPDEIAHEKVGIETKLADNTKVKSSSIVSSSSVFTSIPTSGLSDINMNEGNVSVNKGTVVRSKPFIPKLAISETSVFSDLRGKTISTAPTSLNTTFEPGSGHTDRSVSSISSRSDIEVSSARSINEFNAIIDHLTSTAAKLSDNISGRNSARGVDATFPNSLISSTTTAASASVPSSTTEQEAKKTPRLVHWTNRK